jgi:phenylacetate-coenzyme A ligase PaaK-like adenylate-forming protein
MSDVIFEKTVESVIMKAVGSTLMFEAAVDGNLVTIRRLYSRECCGEQDFSELTVSKDILREIYEAVEVEIDNQNKLAYNKMLDDMMPDS